MSKIEVETVSEQSKKPKVETTVKKNRTNIISSRLTVIVLLVALALLPAFYFYNRSRQAEQKLNDPGASNQRVIDQLLDKVGRHIILPEGERPSLATVNDVNAVREQPFFKNAEIGDKVLVFSESRKAILYRPSKDKIVEVSPLNIDSTKLNVTQ